MAALQQGRSLGLPAWGSSSSWRVPAAEVTSSTCLCNQALATAGAWGWGFNNVHTEGVRARGQLHQGQTHSADVTVTYCSSASLQFLPGFIYSLWWTQAECSVLSLAGQGTPSEEKQKVHRDSSQAWSLHGVTVNSSWCGAHFTREIWRAKLREGGRAKSVSSVQSRAR